MHIKTLYVNLQWNRQRNGEQVRQECHSTAVHMHNLHNLNVWDTTHHAPFLRTGKYTVLVSTRNLLTLSVNKNFSRYRSHLLILNANFDLWCSWQPAFARIDHTHSMERQRSRSIPKFTPKCKRFMLHAHSSLYLPPHNYTPCIKTHFLVKKKKKKKKSR